MQNKQYLKYQAISKIKYANDNYHSYMYTSYAMNFWPLDLYFTYD